MSPMFGHKDDDQQADGKQARAEQWRQAAQAEVARLAALPLAELAAEVMARGFGPGSRGGDDDAITAGQANAGAGPTADGISYRFVPDRGFSSPLPAADDYQLREQAIRLVAEGLQQLEHASLVRFQLHTSMGYLDWAATRRGRAALERGEVLSLLQG
jgi:hypothetical protein